VKHVTISIKSYVPFWEMGRMKHSMKYDTQFCRLLRKIERRPGIFDFTVENREFAAEAQPGQFAHLLVPGKPLRRPISICDADPWQGTLRLVFQIRGEGTEILSRFKEGQYLDILAPLGHGFTLGDPSRKAVFVGGGIGVPPLLFAAKPFGKNATVILGFRNKDAVILKEDFERAGCRVILCTDDGSAERSIGAAERCCFRLWAHADAERRGQRGEGPGGRVPALSGGAHGLRSWRLLGVRL